jgi:hypothetical protein
MGVTVAVARSALGDVINPIQAIARYFAPTGEFTVPTAPLFPGHTLATPRYCLGHGGMFWLDPLWFWRILVLALMGIPVMA